MIAADSFITCDVESQETLGSAIPKILSSRQPYPAAPQRGLQSVTVDKDFHPAEFHSMISRREFSREGRFVADVRWSDAKCKEMESWQRRRNHRDVDAKMLPRIPPLEQIRD